MSKTTNKFSPEVHDRAVRMVGEHRVDYGSEWAAMTSIAGKLGDKDRLKLLEREVKELRRANEILRKASVQPFPLAPVALGPNLRRRSSTAKANGDVLHRRPSRGTGY